MSGKIKVPSELVPSQSNKVLMRSKYLYDDTKGKTQEEVNVDLNQKIDTKDAELNQKIDSKVIAADSVPYDNKPTAGSTNIMQSQYIKKAIENYTGYFVLDNNIEESTVAKTVTGDDKFVLPANGGSIKILMHCRNTAANPTLSINGTTAKALYYNGAAASANNSWDAGEVISVYYDGTRYQASNSRGGSNKKIDAYLLNDVRLLAIGKTYSTNEAIKTVDKQFLRITKEIKELDVTEPIAIGDLRVYNQQTYKALVAIGEYNPTPATPYATGDYVIGSPTKLQLAITKEALTGGNVTVTLGDKTATIEIVSGTSASDITTSLATALGAVENIGWSFVASDGVITATCNDLGDNSSTAFSLSTDAETGVVGTRNITTEGDEETATVLTLTITVGVGIINITLGETTQEVAIAATDEASDIATTIASKTFAEWTLSSDGANVIAECLSAGNNSSTAFSIASNIFGVSGEKTALYNGSINISVYDETTGWSDLTIAQYVAIAAIWGEALTVDYLVENYTTQNTVTQDINEVKDAVFDTSHSKFGTLSTYSGTTNSREANRVLFFRKCVLENCILEKIEFSTAATGTIYIGFINISTNKVAGKLRSYTVSNTKVIDLNIPITDKVALGVGCNIQYFMRAATTSASDANCDTYITVANYAIGASTPPIGGYYYSTQNWRIYTRSSGTSLPDKVEELDERFTDDIKDINDILCPISRRTLGVKGVGSGNLDKGSVWFYFKYEMAAGEIIESIELPSNLTGTFILALGNKGSQKVIEVNRYTLSDDNIIILNKLITESCILGFGYSTAQVLKSGSTNSGTVKYVTVSSIKANSTFAGSYTKGDINVTVNIKRILPTLVERVETLESKSTSVSKPYGDINIIPVHGQSLSLGILKSIPAIDAHKQPILGGLMFNTGIYQVNSGINRMQGIKNLAEGASTFYSSPNYETSCWGTAEMIKKRVIDKVGDNIQTFYVTCGQDGSSINEQFDSELQVLENVMTRVKALFPYKNVKIPCFCYVQGEADQSSGMDGEVYKTKLRAGRAAIQAIAERALGQTTPVRCILYQTIRGYYTAKKITQAHMELCRDDEMFAPSTSVYTLMDPPNNDRLHISNWGQYLLGQYQGIQFVDWIYYGHKNVGVMPLNISISGTKITIKFVVSHPPLRFVTDWITNPGNYGFRVISNGSNIIASNGIEITDSDTVKITCTQNIQNGDMLYYGISLSTASAKDGEGGSHIRACRGNLCDSQGELYTTQVVNDTNNQLTTVALNNYCYAFYQELSV